MSDVEDQEGLQDDVTQDDEGLDEDAEVSEETEDEGEDEEGESKESTYVTKKDLDDLAGALARGTQSQIDKAVSRIGKAVQPRDDVPGNSFEKIVAGYIKPFGLSLAEVKRQTNLNGIKDADTALQCVLDTVDRITAARSLEDNGNDESGEKSEIRQEAPAKTELVEKSTKKNVVTTKRVPKRAGAGDIGETRELLQKQMIAGDIDTQQYTDRLKKLGYDPLRD